MVSEVRLLHMYSCLATFATKQFHRLLTCVIHYHRVRDTFMLEKGRQALVGIRLLFHRIRTTPPVSSCKDLSIVVAMLCSCFRYERIGETVNGESSISQSAIVCPETTWQCRVLHCPDTMLRCNIHSPFGGPSVNAPISGENVGFELQLRASSFQRTFGP